jgi:cell division protein FtsL
VKVDNSQVVREVDPRSFRDLFSLLVLVAVLVAGLVLYAWPHLEIRQTGMATERMNREKERLIEQQRKLRLEKAALENLRRVETIATRELGMATPPPERVIVIERPEPPPASARLARAEADAARTDAKPSREKR